MSWFNRRPKLKASKRIITHHASPVSEKMLEKVKELGPLTNHISEKGEDKK